MSDRGLLFLFSLFMTLAGVAAAGWLIATGQAGSVDGLFLVLTALLVAAAFGLYLVYLVRSVMKAQPQPSAKAAPAGAAGQAKPSPAAVSQA